MILFRTLETQDSLLSVKYPRLSFPCFKDAAERGTAPELKGMSFQAIAAGAWSEPCLAKTRPRLLSKPAATHYSWRMTILIKLVLALGVGIVILALLFNAIRQPPRSPLPRRLCALRTEPVVVKPHVSSPFWRGYFNDLLLIPCALPLILWIQRWLGVRTHDRMPTPSEITFHLVIWSLLFEALGPQWLRVTGDPLDVLAYAVGALIAGAWWWSRRGKTLPHKTHSHAQVGST